MDSTGALPSCAVNPVGITASMADRSGPRSSGRSSTAAADVDADRGRAHCLTHGDDRADGRPLAEVHVGHDANTVHPRQSRDVAQLVQRSRLHLVLVGPHQGGCGGAAKLDGEPSGRGHLGVRGDVHLVNPLVLVNV